MNHLSDEFAHSTVTSKAAKESPTVELVRYLIDVVHADLSAEALTERDAATALMHAHHFLTNADEALIEDDYENENLKFLAESVAVVADLQKCVSREMSIHSLVINWSDNDTEQGTFGTTVRAWDHDHAEYLARSEMETYEDRGSDFNGEVVDHNIGASWKANDLEKALRRLAAACQAVSSATGEMAEALAGAGKVLADIDAL